MAIHFEPCTAVLGARVSGLSLADSPDPTTVELIENALEKYGVLIFPGQEVTPQQQIDFSRAFADLELTELEEARLPGYEEIFVVGNTGEKLVTFAPRDSGYELEWHTDHIHRKVSARASLLYAIEVPSSGGDTLFACMYSAFEALGAEQQADYCELKIINSASGLEDYLADQYPGEDQTLTGRQYEKVIRPLVREHPLSRRKALYFGNQVSIGVMGWDEKKSRAFIRSLTEHACHPRFQYRHQWQAGDAVLWDNRRVLHAGTPYDTESTRRRMHRTTWRENKPF